MKIEYDSEADGLYIWFSNDIESFKREYAEEKWPKELNQEIGHLFNSEGKLMGLEVIPASKYFELDYLEQHSDPNSQ